VNEEVKEQLPVVSDAKAIIVQAPMQYFTNTFGDKIE